MRIKFILMILTFCFLASFHTNASNKKTNKYFGLTPPDTIPLLFASGIISNAGYRLHGVPSFSPDGCEVFWPVIPPKLMHMKLTDSSWTTPEEITFESRGLASSVFSKDGSRLYYQGFRVDGHGSIDIWYVEKSDTGWSKPRNLGSPPNSESMESQPSFTKSKDLYFTGHLDGVGMDRGIYYSRYEGGSYAIPILLDKPINTSAIDYTPFISPEGDYLLFASSRPGKEESNLKLYVSFRLADKTWGSPKNLSEVLGLEKSARFPMISADEQYLFYLSDGNVYWVSTQILNSLRD